MAAIQVADKPTLDRVEDRLKTSGGVNGYPNVSVHPSVGSNGFSITGRGKVTLFANNGSNSLSSLIVDGVAILANTQLMVKPGNILQISFERSISFCGSDNYPLMVLAQLAD